MKLSLFLVITLLIGILSVEYALAQNFDNSEQGTKQYKNDTWSYYSETYDKFKQIIVTHTCRLKK